MSNPNANAFISKYRSDTDYQAWIESQWGKRAFNFNNSILDGKMVAGIHNSFGIKPVPRKCTGSQIWTGPSRHNAKAQGVVCCSKWKNGQMGDGVDEWTKIKEGEDCGYGWNGRPEKMDANDLVMPPRPPPSERAWIKELLTFGKIDNLPTLNNLALKSGAEFLALDLNSKISEFLTILTCLNPTHHSCEDIIETFKQNSHIVVKVERDVISEQLDRLFYDLHRDVLSKKKNSKSIKSEFYINFELLCNTLDNKLTDYDLKGGNIQKKSRKSRKSRKTRKSITLSS
jgi:hypothetical protein